jgi:hypothetical protein
VSIGNGERNHADNDAEDMNGCQQRSEQVEECQWLRVRLGVVSIYMFFSLTKLRITR